MATRKIASLLVDLVARTSRFQSGMDRARRQTMGFSNSVDRSSQMLGRYARSLIAIATTGALAIWVKKSLEAADATAKTADKLGIATEALAGLRHAAEQTAGVTAGTLDTALQRMVRRVSEAAAGTGEAKKALAELGVDAQVLATQSPDAQFRAIADAMQGVASQGDRVRLAMRLFDTEGVALVNTLKVGGDELVRFQAEAERLGIAITRVDAAKIEAANDAMDRVGKLIAGVGQNLAVALAPYIEAASNALLDLAVESDGFREEIAKGIRVAIDGFQIVANVIFRVRQGFDLLGAGALKAFQYVVQGITDADRGFRSMGRFLENLATLIKADFTKMVADLNVVWQGLNLIVAEFVQFSATKIAGLLTSVGSSISRLKGGIGNAMRSAGMELQAQYGDLGVRAMRDFEAATTDAVAAQEHLNSAASNLLNINVDPNERLQTTADSLGQQAEQMVDRALNLERERLAFVQEVEAVVANIQASSQEAAERAAAASPANAAENAVPDPVTESPDALRQRLEQRLQILRDFGVSEREQLALDMQLKMEQLRSALEQDLITKEEFAAAEAALAEQREQSLSTVSEAGNHYRLQDAAHAASAALEISQSIRRQGHRHSKSD